MLTRNKLAATSATNAGSELAKVLTFVKVADFNRTPRPQESLQILRETAFKHVGAQPCGSRSECVCALACRAAGRGHGERSCSQLQIEKSAQLLCRKFAQ